jgi:hypothetical protein
VFALLLHAAGTALPITARYTLAIP